MDEGTNDLGSQGIGRTVRSDSPLYPSNFMISWKHFLFIKQTKEEWMYTEKVTYTEEDSFGNYGVGVDKPW